MEKLGTILRGGFDEDNRTYFGETLDLIERDRDGRITVENRVVGIGMYFDMYLDTGEDVLVTIQLENVTKMNFVTKGTSVAKRWSSWVVVDFMDRMVVTVIRNKVSSGIKATRMTCIVCSSEYSRRIGGTSDVAMNFLKEGKLNFRRIHNPPLHPLI